MTKVIVESKVFEKADFSESSLTNGDYEYCKFLYCNFSSVDLSQLNFSDCEFINCNLSLANLAKSAFRDTLLKDCKLLGLRFDQCNPFLFSPQFENCQLNLSSFYKLTLKKLIFKNSTLHEVDFTETDLTGAIFDNCDLSRAIFDNTVLEKVDFRKAYNYTIDPETNKIKKAKFSTTGISGLLDKYNIEIE